MKIIITGSLGHISKPLAEELVHKGHTVTIISSKAEKQKDIEALGATAAIGSLEDADFLTKTFSGADAVYTMIPPHDFSKPDLDMKEYYRTIATNYAQAIEKSGVKRVVHLSSIGANLENGTGFIVGHYVAEGILNKLTGVAITFMRPAAFYYNLFAFVPVIKHADIIASNYGGDDKVVWVSPKDIASAIAQEIAMPLEGRKIQYVGSDELTCNEVASILGQAIGKPDLKWILISPEEMQKNLTAAGIPPKTGVDIVEMNTSIHTGELLKDYYVHRPEVLGKTKMTDFAQEFAEAFL